MLVDEDSDLLVAWPREAQMACQSRNPTVNLGDRDGLVVEPLDGCQQRGTDPRGGWSHPHTVAAGLSRHAQQTVSILA